jgi:hypothetical protein
MQTVTELFRRLESEHITYAILRNYEMLPELRGGGLTRNTDIDLVVASGELPRVRELLATLAADAGWDVLTECEHFQRSKARHHNIEIFQFYRYAPLDFLQVDVFHGYLTWGLPLMDEKEMLRGRVHDRFRGLTHIDQAKENTFRLIQIHGLGRSARTETKRARYRAKLEAFCQGSEKDFRIFVRRILGPFGVSATAALRSDNQSRFYRTVPLAKAYFFGRYALRHPLSTLWQLKERIRENRTRFHEDPCGCTLLVHSSTESARERFEVAMNALIKLNVLDEWAEEEGDDCKKRCPQILEQGGIVVRWTDRQSASIVVEPGDDPEEISVNVLRHYISRHRALYSKQTVQQMKPRMSAVQA